MDTRLLWLALGGFAGGLEGFIIGSLLPGIGSDMGITLGQAGLLVVAHAIVYGFGTPILQTLIGGIDRRLILACAEAAFALSALMMALSPNFAWLIVARMVLSLGAGMYTSTAMATAVALSPPERRGKALGVVVAGQSLAVLVGAPIGAYISAAFGWRAVYMLIAVLGFLAATALILRLPRGIMGDQRSLRERIGVIKIPGIPITLLLSILLVMGTFMPGVYIAPLAAHAAGIGPDMLPYVLFANGIGAFAGTSIGGRLTDRLSATRAMVISILAMILVLVALGAIPYLPEAARFGAFLFTMMISGLVGWASWPAQSARIAELAPRSVPLAISLNLTASNVGVAVTAAMGGPVIDNFGAEGVVLLSIPFAIAALLVAIYARREDVAGRHSG